MAESACLWCCCKFILTLGLTALFMWLALRASKPTCSIQEFYLPALNKTLNSTKNTSLNLDLKLDNPNKEKGIHYDALNITFFYLANMSSYHIGNVSIPGFYQGHKKKARRWRSVATSGLDWKAIFRAVSVNGSVVFRANLSTAVRYRILGFKTKRQKIVVGANLEVNNQGAKVMEKGIKLKSGASDNGQVGVLLNLLLLLILLNMW